MYKKPCNFFIFARITDKYLSYEQPLDILRIPIELAAGSSLGCCACMAMEKASSVQGGPFSSFAGCNYFRVGPSAGVMPLARLAL